jgi:hypothetical protein
MRYVMFAFFTLLLHANASMSQNAPPIGLPEGDPAAVACPAGQYLAGFNVWSEPQISGFSPYCVAMQSDGRWQGSPQIHLESMLSGALQDSVRVDMFCPRDHFAFGFAGLSQVYGIHGIVQLTLYCHNVKTGASMGIATQTTPGISTTDWPPAQCADTSVATGAYASTRDGEIIQLGLTCGPTKPALAVSRFQSSKESNSIAAIEGRRAGPGVLGEKPVNSGLRASAPPSAELAAGAMDWSQMSRRSSPMSRSTLGMSARPIQPYSEPVLTATPAPGAPVRTTASSKLDQASVTIVGGKPNAGARVPALATPAGAPTHAPGTASAAVDLNSAAVKAGIIIVSGKPASSNLPAQSTLTH